MRKWIGFLFPCRKTYKRLDLQKRWWHRLAVVVFFVALVPTLLYSWVIGDDAYTPLNSFEGNINYWEILIPPPQGYVLDQTSPTTAPPDASYFDRSKIVAPLASVGNVDNKNLLKTIEMPDGTTVTYPGATSDETIHAKWNHSFTITKAKAMIFGFGWAVVATLIFSYLLQAAYRAFVYVIYGAKSGAAPDSPVA
jgi:hypothetical protein